VPPKLRATYGKRAQLARRLQAADGGGEGGVLNITAVVWNAGFHWWLLATKSERKMLASTCLYSLYAWLYKELGCVTVTVLYFLKKTVKNFLS